jgi:hypothetical protein
MNMLHKLCVRLKKWLGASEAGEDKSRHEAQFGSNLPQSEPAPPVEVPASAPSTGSDDQSLSDLEKLLAEEGSLLCYNK